MPSHEFERVRAIALRWSGTHERSRSSGAGSRGVLCSYAQRIAYVDRLQESQLDWHDIAEVIREAYRVVAPRKLIAELEAQPARDQ